MSAFVRHSQGIPNLTTEQFFGISWSVNTFFMFISFIFHSSHYICVSVFTDEETNKLKLKTEIRRFSRFKEGQCFVGIFNRGASQKV